MSDSKLTELVQGLVPIGTHNGWKLTYHPGTDSFQANKGQKVRNHQRRQGLIDACDDADAETVRKQRRIEPCEFLRWDPKTQTEQSVKMTSYSNRGAALKPTAGGDTFYVERDRWGNNEGAMLLIVPPGKSTKRLHQAVEGLRRAQEELRQAENETVIVVKIQDPGYGSRVADFHAEEDRLRAEILKVTNAT